MTVFFCKEAGNLAGTPVALIPVLASSACTSEKKTMNPLEVSLLLSVSLRGRTASPDTGPWE